MEFGFGTGVLTGIRTDVTGTQVPVRFGAFQGVQLEFSGDTKQLYAMGQYPIDTARGKVKISGKAKVAQIQARMYNELFFGQTVAAGSTRYAFNEKAVLPSGTPTYTILNATSTPLTDQGVFEGATQFQLTPVSSAPASGQYTFDPSAGTYTFPTNYAGQLMYVNYTYTATSGFNITSVNPIMGTTPRFQATMFQQSPHSTQHIVLVLYSCVSSRMSFPTSIDDYVIQDLDFEAFEAPSGLVFSWSTSE